MKNLIEIANKFQISSKALVVKPHGDGLINNTYAVTCSDNSQYILQNINTNVFKQPIEVQQNIELVTNHIKNKLKEGTDNEYQTSLTLILTKEGINYYKDEENKYWRVFELIADTISYNNYENQQVAINAGKAYAQFHQHLADVDIAKIHETIAQFHYLPMRVDQFNKSIQSALKKRLFDASELINWVKDNQLKYIQRFNEIVNNCPVRIVHQDTKANNILFDKTNKAVSIIDLDTVMPGYLFVDYGDALRVAANTEDENSIEFDKIDFNKPVFESFTQGYFSKAKDFITEAEADTLAYGIEILLFEQGIRFLTDFLNNDIYYKTEYAEHNFNRAKNQIICLKKVIENRDYIDYYIQKLRS